MDKGQKMITCIKENTACRLSICEYCNPSVSNRAFQNVDFLNACIEDIQRRLEVYGWKEEWRLAYQAQLDDLLAKKETLTVKVGA